MKVIGLTGGIGSGKSTVLRYFEELGVETFIADEEAKKLMNSNAVLIGEIKTLFGNQAYENGELNRGFIASIVFKDKEKLEALNNLVHPIVRQHFQQMIKDSQATFVIYEAAILFESGSDEFCDYIVTVAANLQERIQRVMKRDGVSKELVEDRMRNQLNDELKIKKADFVVNNEAIKDTKTQVNTIFQLLLKLK